MRGIPVQVSDVSARGATKQRKLTTLQTKPVSRSKGVFATEQKQNWGKGSYRAQTQRRIRNRTVSDRYQVVDIGVNPAKVVGGDKDANEEAVEGGTCIMGARWAVDGAITAVIDGNASAKANAERLERLQGMYGSSSCSVMHKQSGFKGRRENDGRYGRFVRRRQTNGGDRLVVCIREKRGGE